MNIRAFAFDMRIKTDILQQTHIGARVTNTLAFCAYVKSRYKNSSTYFYKDPQKVKLFCDELKISRNTYFAYINTAVKMDWAVIHKGTFTVRSMWEEKRKQEFITINRNYYQNKVKHGEGIKTGVKILHSFNLTRIASQQRSIIQCKLRTNAGNERLSPEDYMKAKASYKTLKKRGYAMSEADNGKFEVNEQIQFSIATLTKKLNVSQYRLYQTIKHMKEKQLLAVTTNIKRLEKKYSFSEFMKMSRADSRLFRGYNGDTYLREGNTYHFKYLPVLA